MRTIVQVDAAVRETPSTVTLRFRYAAPAFPGQFIMLWLPGDDELPMSLSYTEDELKGVTIKSMGATSRRSQSIAPGDRLGVRGPYGNRFDTGPRRILLVAGGSGAAVLAPAAEAARARGAELTVALGATTASELLFRGRFEAMGAGLVLATDDGTAGEHGLVTVPATRLLAERDFDAVWTCGPEAMMARVVDAAREHGVPARCSVERHMKCALGMCDACALGPYHVCVDGPVFTDRQLTSTEDFGHYHRDPSGRRRPFRTSEGAAPGDLIAQRAG